MHSSIFRRPPQANAQLPPFPEPLPGGDQLLNRLRAGEVPGADPVNEGNEGSDPDLSATQSGLQRNLAALWQESLKIAAILQVLPSNSTGEGVPSNPAGKFSGVFSGGHTTVRFQRLHQANAIRSQIDNEANAA